MKTGPRTRKGTPRAPSRQPSRGRREQNKEKTRERILEAALRLFRDKGLERTTTREISRAARIAEGTLFNYFQTKEDLALYFFQKGTEELITWFRADTRLQKAPLVEQLFAIVHRQLEYIEPYEDFIGSVFYRALQPASAFNPLSLDSQELRLKYLRFIRSVLAEAEQREGVPHLGDLGAYAFGLFYLGIVLHWLHDDSRGKQRTLALLDRALTIGTRVFKQGGWEW